MSMDGESAADLVCEAAEGSGWEGPLSANMGTAHDKEGIYEYSAGSQTIPQHHDHNLCDLHDDCGQSAEHNG